jgi:DNA-binding Lrp family transcriptional regulator
VTLDGVDETDAAILAALQSNGRAELLAVADATDIPGTTVRDRLKAMEERGVVEGYTARVDYDRAGYGTTAVFRLQVPDDSLDAVVGRLRERERFRTVYELTGAWNVLAVGTFGSVAELETYSKQLVTDADVTAVNADVVSRTVTAEKQVQPPR